MKVLKDHVRFLAQILQPPKYIEKGRNMDLKPAIDLVCQYRQ